MRSGIHTRWRLAILATVLVPLIGGQAAAQSPADKQAAWAKAWPRMMQAERESAAEINAAIKEIDEEFAASTAKARPFVDNLLGLWGKYQFACGGADKINSMATGFIDNVFGTKISQSGPDQFTRFACDTFVKEVFDPAAFKRAIEAATEGYASRLQGVEGTLLVDLEADLPDSDLRLDKAIPVLKLTNAMRAHIDQAVADAIADAGTDFAVTAGRGWYRRSAQAGLPGCS